MDRLHIIKSLFNDFRESLSKTRISAQVKDQMEGGTRTGSNAHHRSIHGKNVKPTLDREHYEKTAKHMGFEPKSDISHPEDMAHHINHEATKKIHDARAKDGLDNQNLVEHQPAHEIYNVEPKPQHGVDKDGKRVVKNASRISSMKTKINQDETALHQKYGRDYKTNEKSGFHKNHKVVMEHTLDPDKARSTVSRNTHKKLHEKLKGMDQNSQQAKDLRAHIDTHYPEQNKSKGTESQRVASGGYSDSSKGKVQPKDPHTPVHSNSAQESETPKAPRLGDEPSTPSEVKPAPAKAFKSPSSGSSTGGKILAAGESDVPRTNRTRGKIPKGTIKRRVTDLANKLSTKKSLGENEMGKSELIKSIIEDVLEKAYREDYDDDYEYDTHEEHRADLRELARDRVEEENVAEEYEKKRKASNPSHVNAAEDASNRLAANDESDKGAAASDLREAKAISKRESNPETKSSGDLLSGMSKEEKIKRAQELMARNAKKSMFSDYIADIIEKGNGDARFNEVRTQGGAVDSAFDRQAKDRAAQAASIRAGKKIVGRDPSPTSANPDPNKESAFDVRQKERTALLSTDNPIRNQRMADHAAIQARANKSYDLENAYQLVKSMPEDMKKEFMLDSVIKSAYNECGVILDKSQAEEILKEKEAESK